VGTAAGFEASIAEKPRKIKPQAITGSSSQSQSAISCKSKVLQMQRLYLRRQRFEAVVVVDHVVRRLQSLLSGNL
jgi:hypothetical protein